MLIDVTYMGNRTNGIWLGYEENPSVYIPGNCAAGQYGLTAAGPCSKDVHEGDVLLAIDDHPVASDGNVELDLQIARSVLNKLERFVVSPRIKADKRRSR